MGRKSRRMNNIQAPDQVHAPVKKAEAMPTAIYARLSDKNSGKDDNGAAIENQIEVCKEYIREAPDLKLVRVFMDNGWTGTNLNRPSFEDMMDAVRSGEIKAIVVRDLSRLGRNYQDTDGLLEVIFPQMDVRFVSVKERLDTKDLDWNSDTLKVELQNLINDFYARDISRKIHAAYKIQKENKTFSWRNIPFGYKWNADHSNIVPDEETAGIVRMIFRWRLEGHGVQVIARMLNEKGIKSSFARKRGEDRVWIAATVRDLLKNPAYIGNKVWGRRRKELYRGINMERTPESEWTILENAHEPIVSKEDFEKVREMAAEGKKSFLEERNRNREYTSVLEDRLEGKVFCGECGNRMYFKKSICRQGNNAPAGFGSYYCRQDIKRQDCSYHSISQKKLEKVIMEVIRSHMEIAVDYDELIKQLRKSHSGLAMEKKLSFRVASIQGKIHSVRGKRLRLYGDYTDGIIGQEDYSYAKSQYDEEYAKLNSELDEAVKKLESYKETVSPENKWIAMLKNIEESDELTRGLADATIDRVTVYKGGAVEIRLKYQDVYELTDEYLEKLKEGA